jgi:hypothetical protein
MRARLEPTITQEDAARDHGKVQVIGNIKVVLICFQLPNGFVCRISGFNMYMFYLFVPLSSNVENPSTAQIHAQVPGSRYPQCRRALELTPGVQPKMKIWVKISPPWGRVASPVRPSAANGSERSEGAQSKLRESGEGFMNGRSEAQPR